MEINVLGRHHQLALMLQGRAGNDEERRAFRQFEHDYFVQIEPAPIADEPPALAGRDTLRLDDVSPHRSITERR